MARVPMVALKSWRNESEAAEGHVMHAGIPGNVRRGKKFEAVSEDRARVLERKGLAMRDPEGFVGEMSEIGGGGSEPRAERPTSTGGLPPVPSPAASGPDAGSPSSSVRAQALREPTSAQFVKPAGSAELSPATGPKVAPAKQSTKLTRAQEREARRSGKSL